jgi:hypothetical protein
MSQTPRPADESSERELAEYRALSPLAIVGLVLGLLSPVALLDPAAWCVPLLGIVISLIALRRIARDWQMLAGRGVAWTGLTLALLFAVAAPSDWLLYRYFLRREAVQFAQPWFQLLGTGQMHRAFLLTVDPRSRPPLDLSLPDLCNRSAQFCEDLEAYRQEEAVKTLATLGASQVRFLTVDDQTAGADRDYVRPVFEVRSARDPRQAPLRVTLSMERLRLRGGEGWHLGRADWRILRAEIHPAEKRGQAHIPGGLRYMGNIAVRRVASIQGIYSRQFTQYMRLSPF